MLWFCLEIKGMTRVRVVGGNHKLHTRQREQGRNCQAQDQVLGEEHSRQKKQLVRRSRGEEGQGGQCGYSGVSDGDGERRRDWQDDGTCGLWLRHWLLSGVRCSKQMPLGRS